jgi:immune inhibitor A
MDGQRTQWSFWPPREKNMGGEKQMDGRAIRILLIVVIFLLVLAPPTLAAVTGNSSAHDPLVRSDKLVDPLTANQESLKQTALKAKLNGKVSGNVAEVARGQYVELAREREGEIWTVLGEFKDFPHNSIAEPDRTVNNTTAWIPDFNREHFMDLLFNEAPGANSMSNFYIEQSSNRYAVNGDVTDWVLCPLNAADYDDGGPGPGDEQHVWQFLVDSANGWYDSQIAAGKTADEINAYLAQFDLWDRYDYDYDGDFNEPDGYIDTFQSVHAGEGNEAGGGALGDNAIWSHSWYAYFNLIGSAGPTFNMSGGFQIGNSDYWVGKYTIQPENGGVGVFVHEFGHDLGLPDLYDTSGGENGTGYWTLMSAGSWLDDGLDTIGNKASHMGAWEKLQLGWLNYQVAPVRNALSRDGSPTTNFKLGPMEYNSSLAQGVIVQLPKKMVTTSIGAPFAGSRYYYSGAGDNLDNFMYRSFNLGAGATLTAKVNYEIELDWDYAYLVYSTDSGGTWTPIQTNLSTTTDPNGQNLGEGITGTSGGWVDLTANLPAGNVLLGFGYRTDISVAGFGFMVDSINITGHPTDGAETSAGWTFAPTSGFHVTTGIESAAFDHYYVAEYRTYKGYDSTLKTGPYFFGYQDNPLLQSYVDHFPYQDGLLINYWDTSQTDNQTAIHPGRGLLLPIDAHYKTLYRIDGVPWDNRIQTYDSTFTLDRTDALTSLHVNSVLSPVRSQPGVKVFDDRYLYWDATNPQASVKNPSTGTKITIKSANASTGIMQIQVQRARTR